MPSTVRFLRSRAVGVLCLLCSGCASNGVDLTLWQQVGDAQWRFGERGIEAGPANTAGYLVSNEQFADVTIVVDFWIEDLTNSGIFVRCENPTEVDPFSCYEINIWDNHPRQDFRTGSIVTRQPPLAHVDTLGTWNECRIDVRGDRIEVAINGVVTAEFEDGSLRRGYVALQYAGEGIVRFRDFRLMAR